MTRQNPTWSCKVGIIGECDLPPGADSPMRRAVEEAFRQITGVDPQFNFSGWGASLDEHELAVVENRLPSEAHYQEWLASQGPDKAALAMPHPISEESGRIVQRLRNPPFGTETSERNLMAAAADEIERLREVLGSIASASRSEGGCYYTNRLNIDRARDALRKARGES